MGCYLCCRSLGFMGFLSQKLGDQDQGPEAAGLGSFLVQEIQGLGFRGFRV